MNLVKMKKNAALLTFGLLAVFMVQGQSKYRSITWEKFESSAPELTYIGNLETRHSTNIDSSPWSVGCETLDRDYGDFDTYKEYVGELGVKHARLQSGWAKSEREKGVYDFAWLDVPVQGLVKQGVAPWISLSYGNPLYKSEIDLGSGIFTDEETMNAWCRYVEATVRRYKDVVEEWEIWNEPRHSESPEAYANLLIRTSESIKKVQPNATILGFTVHGFSPEVVLKFPKAVLEILKTKKKLDIVDYVTYHPYTPNPDECYSMVEGLKSLIHSYNPKLKLYQGESGSPSALEWGHAMFNYPWTEYSQVKWDLRRMVGDRVRDIRSSIFTMVDLRYTSMLQSFGLIRSNLKHEFIYKRPAFYGVQHVVSFFDYSVIPQGMLDYSSNSQRKMTVGGFEKEGKPVVVVWYNDQIPDDQINWDLVQLRIKDLQLKNPVYVELITGKVFEIEQNTFFNAEGAVTFENLPLWDSPILITERELVNLRAE